MKCSSRMLGILLATSMQLAAAADGPNVVFILADDMGYVDLGAYGATDLATPHLDRLAREGVKLTDNYAAAPVCTPTRIAFVTGRYQQRVGMEWARGGLGTSGLHTSEVSIARMLKNNGYATAIIGKWHMGGRPETGPNAHGFDEFFGHLGANVDFYKHRQVVPKSGVPDLFENTEPVERKGYMTDLITERSVRFIERHAGEPFFLFVSYNAPHWPFQPPDPPSRRWEASPENRLEGTRKDYNRMVERLDEGIGQILETLDQRGLAEGTLVIFTSDNGGERLSRNLPFFNHKATLWEGGIRVPCLIRWPGQLPAGKTSEQMAITMDLSVSILVATGTVPPAGRTLDGIDLLPILRGKKPLQERTFFWRIPFLGECTPPPPYWQCSRQKAVRKGRWKYVQDGIENLDMLFDLETDPAERQTLAYQKPEIVRELKSLLESWEQDLLPVESAGISRNSFYAFLVSGVPPSNPGL